MIGERQYASDHLTRLGIVLTQGELGLSDSGPIGGRRLSEAVSLNLGADYVSELGTGGAWADQRLTKSEIAADPEAAALVSYFRQVPSCFCRDAVVVHVAHAHARTNDYARTSRAYLPQLAAHSQRVAIQLC